MTQVLRAFCEHGKVRAMMTEPDADANDYRARSYRADFRQFRREIAVWARSTDYVTVEEARKSNMTCVNCRESSHE